MDFRLLALCFSLWLFPAWASIESDLNDLPDTVYQYPNEALSKIEALESALDQDKLTPILRLRLALLKCETFVQLGENEAAINLGRMSDAKAKAMQIESARPYFLNCMAGAYIDYGDLRQALTLLDASIYHSRELKQPQSLVNGLLLRGRVDIQIESESSALEDLRLAQDIYPETLNQQPHWIVPPFPYIQLAMAELLSQKGLFNQAFNTARATLDNEQSTGKVRINLLLNLAKIAHKNQEVKFRDDMILEAKILIPELATATELAESYNQLAEIEFLRGNDKSAIQLLNIAINTFEQQKKISDSLHAHKLLAEIELANGNEAAGLDLMKKAIGIAERTNQFYQLVICYQVLSDYFASVGNYQQANQYQRLRFDTAKHSYEYLKDTRLLQIKARLARYQQLAQSKKTNTLKLDTHLGNNYGLFGIILLFLLLTLLLIFSRLRGQKPPKQEMQGFEPMAPLEKMEALLASAKQIGFPITILLINPSHFYRADMKLLSARICDKLRQQDMLFNKEADQMLIMLPFTHLEGAMQISQQLEAAIEPLQSNGRVAIGIAVMRHHDTLNTLIKRASIDQLSKHNEHLAH
ncbi:histidine kinase [Shewanella colwelliana]|uniref:histidine kinase n=1 Tax=Shewanella colwelliana TaxID=23 RepID=UPI00299E3899|nr:histidine kinase [Shewanella colwelliana]MDX1281013.1 histidine kinase [Shewanella colwelliana]